MTRYDWSHVAGGHYYPHRPGYIVIHTGRPPFEQPQRRVMRWWLLDEDISPDLVMRRLGFDGVPEKLPPELHPAPPMETEPGVQFPLFGD